MYESRTIRAITTAITFALGATAALFKVAEFAARRADARATSKAAQNARKVHSR